MLVGLGGFVDSSAGGGGLISLPAYLFAGLPAHAAYGCNKLSSSVGTTFAAANFLRSGSVDLLTGLCAAASSFAGSTLFSRLVMFLPEETFRRLIILVIPVACIIIFSRRNVPDADLSDRLSVRKKSFLPCL